MDLAHINTLYRPGIMGKVSTLIYNKHHHNELQYPIPIMADILDETYGILVYQEQMMLLAQK